MWLRYPISIDSIALHRSTTKDWYAVLCRCSCGSSLFLNGALLESCMEVDWLESKLSSNPCVVSCQFGYYPQPCGLWMGRDQVELTNTRREGTYEIWMEGTVGLRSILVFRETHRHLEWSKVVVAHPCLNTQWLQGTGFVIRYDT